MEKTTSSFSDDQATSETIKNTPKKSETCAVSNDLDILISEGLSGFSPIQQTQLINTPTKIL